MSGHIECDYLDRLFSSVDGRIRQLLVVMFLFYSGYGVALSIRNKGKQYLEAMPHKRIAVTLINFIVAVCFFIIIDLLIGQPVTFSQSLLSLIGWESVGNSNWYIFCILLCYLFTYISFLLCKNQVGALILLGLFCLAYILVISRFKGGWWYDTIAAYWFGVCFSVYYDRFRQIVERHYYSSLICSLGLFLLFYTLPFRNLALADNITAIFFSLSILIITMRIQIDNAPLRWLGKHLFPLYIYQRIPMIILAVVGEGYLIANHKWIYILASLVIVISIAALYNRFEIKASHIESMFRRGSKRVEESKLM